MIYREYQGQQISQLAFGAMRLPVIDGNDNVIDEKTAVEMVDYAMAHGINYYDTAWGYHGGNSELVMGKALSKYDRSSYMLASKFPGYDHSNMTKAKEIFEKQLEKCQTEYFDFYMFHNVCEMNIDAYLDPKFGIFDYLHEQKKNGRIKHLGFSAHGDLDTMKKFLEAYGNDMEFCQIQLNWIDWEFQAAKDKVAMLNTLGIPVWVMEPLRGGSILKLEDRYIERLEKMRSGCSTIEWAFRFLQSIPGITTILSGMSTPDQLKENIELFDRNDPLKPAEVEELISIAREMTSVGTVPCTACHYCINKCPLGLDIPRFMSLYNEHTYSKGGFLAPMALAAVPKDKRPSACVACRSCERVCPQKIEISDVMQKLSKAEF